MTILWLALLVVAAGFVTYALCKVGGDADRLSEDLRRRREDGP